MSSSNQNNAATVSATASTAAAASSVAASVPSINFTVDLNEKSKDFILNTGIPAAKMNDEMIDKITKAGGEYQPQKKNWVVPYNKLCDLLDECFDYFTEDSLVNISKLLDKANVEKEIKDKVREKSVSKSKGMQHKRQSRPVPPMIKEEDDEEDFHKRSRIVPVQKAKKNPLFDTHEDDLKPFPEAPNPNRNLFHGFVPPKQEQPFPYGKPQLPPRTLSQNGASSLKPTMSSSDYYRKESPKEELMTMLSDLRYRMAKIEQYVINM